MPYVCVAQTGFKLVWQALTTGQRPQPLSDSFICLLPLFFASPRALTLETISAKVTTERQVPESNVTTELCHSHFWASPGHGWLLLPSGVLLGFLPSSFSSILLPGFNLSWSPSSCHFSGFHSSIPTLKHDSGVQVFSVPGLLSGEVLATLSVYVVCSLLHVPKPGPHGWQGHGA